MTKNNQQFPINLDEQNPAGVNNYNIQLIVNETYIIWLCWHNINN